MSTMAAALAGQGARPGDATEYTGRQEDRAPFVAVSPAMKSVLSRAKLVAAVDVPALILGETGTGKEVVARFIHKLSPRGHRGFFKVHRAAIPTELLESELFGHEAGAFTGAIRSKPGRFELANGGTLLLDEIGEMPPSLQAKLLHMLQDGMFQRLGSLKSVQADARIIAATNVDVSNALREGTLREDLYYRLSVVTIHLPPLRVIFRQPLWRRVIRTGGPATYASSKISFGATSLSVTKRLR